jgi:hypothetical protein
VAGRAEGRGALGAPLLASPVVALLGRSGKPPATRSAGPRDPGLPGTRRAQSPPQFSPHRVQSRRAARHLVVAIGGSPPRSGSRRDQQVRFASTGAAQALERAGAPSDVGASPRRTPPEPTPRRGNREEIVPSRDVPETSDLRRAPSRGGEVRARAEELPWGDPGGRTARRRVALPRKGVRPGSSASWRLVQARAEVAVACWSTRVRPNLEDRVGLPSRSFESDRSEPAGWVASPRALNGGAGAARVGKRASSFAVPLPDPMVTCRSVEARLPTGTSTRPSGGFSKALRLAVVIGSLAVLFGIVLARLVARPVRELTESSVRIGRGSRIAGSSGRRRGAETSPGRGGDAGQLLG